MKALEMSARRRTFDILHHSQLVFSAEMSDQLTALPLTFNRKDGDTDAGGARLDGRTEGRTDSCVPACIDLLCFHLDPAFSHDSMQSPSQNLGDLSRRCCSHPRPPDPHPTTTTPTPLTNQAGSLASPPLPLSAFICRHCRCERAHACVRGPAEK